MDGQNRHFLIVNLHGIITQNNLRWAGTLSHISLTSSPSDTTILYEVTGDYSPLDSSRIRVPGNLIECLPNLNHIFIWKLKNVFSERCTFFVLI